MHMFLHGESISEGLRWGVRLQGQAESFLEKLHGMAEKQVNAFLDLSVSVDGWGKFRETLIGLTDVTRNHFDKLVQVRPFGTNQPSEGPQAVCSQIVPFGTTW